MAKSVTLRKLKERCGLLESHVRRLDYATEQELTTYRPGGSENPQRDTWAWVVWFAQLTRFCGREETAGPTASSAQHELADGQILDALRNEPEEVRLPPREKEGEPRVLYVYPKSLDALLNIHARDHLLLWLNERYAMLLDRATADDMALAERAAQEIAYQYQLLIWTVCHPGPGKPFDVEEERPLPPDWTDLYGVENLLICKAHMNVNGHRLQTLETLIAPKKRKPGVEQRPSWSVFIGSLAVQLKKDPRTLMCDTSLAELLATVKLAAPPEPEKKKSA